MRSSSWVPGKDRVTGLYMLCNGMVTHGQMFHLHSELGQLIIIAMEDLILEILTMTGMLML